MTARPPLSPDRIITAAVAVADRDGLAGVSMRSVGRELRVEAMSLYHHIADKDALLDGLADRIVATIELPSADLPWRRAMADRAASARSVLSAHPWALGLIESRRSPGPALFRHHDAVLGNLRTNGFDVALAAHAFSAIDAYVYGFVLTETTLPIGPDEDIGAFVEQLGDLLDPERYPHLFEQLQEQVMAQGYDYGDEFDDGLELILDGLERRLGSGPTTST